ncbi:hypothetical protein BROSI_A1658 [Candidatus Brocadia sinica JPN1]|uniref:Uncharacterized protein n=1 Tax=Candidatus Brocadia sinica JPN1 TaxID=1197129 RepID=A0ABQ0JWS5_9BACT|nr:hypothetical protein BROSI_A1658 [Candidatus Brocadia sinica JPN1]
MRGSPEIIKETRTIEEALTFKDSLTAEDVRE